MRQWGDLPPELWSRHSVESEQLGLRRRVLLYLGTSATAHENKLFTLPHIKKAKSMRHDYMPDTITSLMYGASKLCRKTSDNLLQYCNESSWSVLWA